MTRVLTQSLYALTAAIFLSAGGSVLFLGTNLLPAIVRQFIMAIADGRGETLHILQEFGCLLVFAGLITLWFLRHYEHSRPFHWALTVFWALFAWVHWFDTQGHFHRGIGPVLPTVPLIIFLVAGVMREKAERG